MASTAPRVRLCARIEEVVALFDYAPAAYSSGSFKITRRRPATFRDYIEIDSLAFGQSTQSGRFDCADVHKYVFVAGLRLDESKPFLGIEKFNSSCSHDFGLHSKNLHTNRVQKTNNPVVASDLKIGPLDGADD